MNILTVIKQGMLQNLKAMKGGQKQMWLRQHHAEVMAYRDEHGDEVTREHFNIKNDTAWQHILNPKAFNTNKIIRADVAIARAEIAEQKARDAEHQVRELRESYGQFVNEVADQLKAKFFVPLMQHTLQFSGAFESKPVHDPLQLSDITHKNST